ncbi:ATP-binding protein [Bdellovibrio sp. HCB290]|uniref:ATP-binding protein n=1 Tax=Bdellovibrio sp. HCB290 TaxID=3394356 RepID=UPI0039B4628F
MITNHKDPGYLKTPRALTLGGLILLGAIAFLAFLSGKRLLETAAWRRHAYVVLGEIKELKAKLEETKSSYIALYTDPTQAYDTFIKSQHGVHQAIINLNSLVLDNKDQSRLAKKIQTLVNIKIALWQSHAVALQKGGNSTADQFKTFLSTTETSEVDRLISEIENEEQEILMRRTASVDRNFQITTIVVIGGLAIAFLIFLFSTRLLQKQIIVCKRIEVELERARSKAQEASNLKSSFLANMSHEIRTPLNGIIGMTKLFEQTPLNNRQLDYLETIKTSSTSLLSLINEILDLSKIESGKLQLEETNFELSSLVKSAVTIVEYSARLKGLTISTEISSQVPEFLKGDPLRLRQVLLNLLNNAIKFSEHGLIKVKVTPYGPDKNGAPHLLFEIVDQGVGFDLETKSRLFQSFSQGDSSMTRKYGGTGLGLAISKQIVEMMNGTIDVDSVKGIGSRFFFDVTLGLPGTDSDIKKISSLKPVMPLQGRVLIAEDNLVNQKVVSEMLSTMGCSSQVVENGYDAIGALLTEKFDLILMDAQMPGMDGYEATRRIRKGQAGEDNRYIPILATTANAIKGDIELCLEAGMNDYISKPISYNDLAFKISKWIKAGSQIGKPLETESSNRKFAQHGDKLLQEVAVIFNQDSPILVANMKTAAAVGDIKQVAALAHNLKSSAAYLGALRLKEIAERIESLDVESTDRQQVSLLVESLTKELKLAQEDLKARIKNLPPQNPN